MLASSWLNLRPDRRSVLSLAVWGPHQSGKTALLAMINSYCDSYGWAVLPAKAETADYIEKATDYFFERDPGEFPPPTPPETPIIHRFSFQGRTRWRRREVIVEAPDAAGEIFANPEHPVFNMVQYLNNCLGILWLLDPIALKEERFYGKNGKSYRRMIYRTLSRIFQTQYGSRGQIDKYMAFVLTKMDHPEHSRYFDTPKEYALDLLGKQVERYIENFCVIDRIEFFSTSAVGFADKEKTISNVDYSNPDKPTLRTRDIWPVGVFDPFKWILEQLL